ncbi:MAG TPA: hypothetical protein VK272_14065 [Solirubrobacteraceae bacterium]|nr:hypothetical protein [Solirubrobacteraceae bacterium]
MLVVVGVLVWLPGGADAGGTAPSNTALPVLSGKAVDGQLLETTKGTWSGTEPITYTYQWQACNRQGKECENLPSATEASYRVTSADVEEKVRAVVTAKNEAGTAAAASVVTGEVASGPPVALEAPVITGGAWEGATLSVGGEGWAGSGVTASYQWRRCSTSGAECTDIAGATESRYTLSSADVGHTLRVRVGAGGSAGSLVALSAPTLTVAAKSTLKNTWAPSMSGTAKVGQTLTANPGSWVGLATLSYAYQWQRCNREGGECANVSGATASTYVLASADAGKSDRVLVTASEEKANAATVASAGELIANEKGPVLETAPAATGTGLPEYTLTATTGKWAGSGITYAYKWQKCNEAGEACAAISGATSRTYKLPTSAAGSTTRVLVTATSSGNSTEALSAPITVSATAVSDVSLPMVSGTTQVAHTLTATNGLWTDAVGITYTYQWERCNSKGESCATISGASESTYTPVSADSGDTDRVKVTATGSSGNASATSAVSGVIAGGSGSPEDSVAPSIEGYASSGSTLTAQPGLWFGEEPVTYSYQWEKCNEAGESCAAIGGATSQTYVLGSGEVGSTVRVSVTAKNSSGQASDASAASETIEAAASASVSERPAIKGTAQEGNELFAENGKWTGSQPLRYFYRWERCNTAGEKCALISGATKPGYKTTSSDVGSTLRVSVTVTNSLGGASSLSPQTSVVAGKEASAKEAMELAEKTDPSVIATPSSATLEGQTIKPNAEDAGEGLAATSTLTSSWLSKETSGEFAVNTPIGEISLKPLSTAPNATVTPLIVNGAAAVYAGTQTATDTIVRPEPLGATAMLQMRSSTAPTSFSWQVGLGANQKLQVLPNGSVAVTESGAGSGLEGEVEETEEKPSNETAAETKGEEGYSAEAAAEAFQNANPETTKLSKLPNSSTSTTGETKPKSGELQPQETKAQYEAATTATSYAESHTENTTLMTLPVPTVVDAEDHSVAASLSVEGNTIKLTITPGSAKYPVTAAVTVDAPTNTASAKRTPASTFGFSSQASTPFQGSEEEIEGNWKVEKHMDKNLTEGKAIKVKYARLIIPYDNNPKGEVLDNWLEQVGKTTLPGGARLVPVITLTHCSEWLEPENEKRPPAGCEKEEQKKNFPELYYRKVLSLMKALVKGKEHIPPVRLFGAWNEPELSNLGGIKKASVAAEVWGAATRALRKAGCRAHCKVIAGEFAGYRKLKGYASEKAYVEGYEKSIVEDARKKKWDAGKPEIWGLHDYKDPKETAEAAVEEAKKLVRKNGTGAAEAQAFVQGTAHRAGLGHPQDWITEAGVQLWVRNGPTSLGGKTTQEEEAHRELQRVAAEDFLELGKQPTGHIEVNTYYQYKAPAALGEQDKRLGEMEHGGNVTADFDSALLSDEGKAPENQRPAYCVIALADKGACPPATKTQPAVPASIKASGATVSFTVNPSGAATKYEVEYGTTTSYGHTTTAGTTANAVGEQSETVEVSGLEACTTYHYQAEAENEANEDKPALGGDQTFTTGGCVATQVTGGYGTCALISSGAIDCWGYDAFGELGNGMEVEEAKIGPVSGITNATQVAGGYENRCAVLKTEKVMCWGQNYNGQIGDGTLRPKLTPATVEGITTAKAVGGGGELSCALLASGGVDCWGINVYGGLGDGSIEGPEICREFRPLEFYQCSTKPVAVKGITNATSLSVGALTSCAVLATGHIDCWGANFYGELGDGSEAEYSDVPVEVSGITNATAVDVGREDACAVLASGEIDCWGSTLLGELGNGTEGFNKVTTPAKVTGITNATQVSAGPVFTCARLSTGHLMCWGDGESGELGDGSKTKSNVPVEVSGITSAVEVATGAAYACARLSGGALECWGHNSAGDFNYPPKPPEGSEYEFDTTPVKVPGFP